MLKLTRTTGTVCAFALATCMAMPAALAQDEDFEASVKTAKDYIAGKLKLDLPKVTYSGPPIEVKLSSFIGKAAYMWKPWNGAFEQLEKETGGKLKIKAFPGGVLHAARDGFKAVRDGIADVSHCYVGYQPTSFKLYHLTGVAGMFSDSPSATAAMMELYPKYFKKEYEAQGVYLLRSYVTPAYNIVSKNPVTKLEDLKGFKLRTTGGIQADLAKAVGSVPVFVSAAESYTAFQRGTVDGVAGHDGAFIIFRTAEPAKHWVDTRFAAVELGICVNRKFFDGLPKDLKTHFYNWAQRWNQVDSQLWFEEFAYTARKKMTAMGITMHKIDPAERKRIIDGMKSVEDEWVAKLEKEGFKDVKAMLADMRRVVAEKEKKSWNDLFMDAATKPVKGVIDF